MKYASIPWARAAPSTIASRKNTGLFARILEGLHHSRRLQARRFLRTHRHLIADSRDDNIKPNMANDDNAIIENPSPVRRSSKSPGPSENTTLAILAGALLLLNILVCMIMHRALPNKPGGQRAEVIVSRGD
jgi:hypothetical protein